MDSSNNISPEMIRAQLERIVNSREFAASERLCRFLRYVVDRTLEGRGDELKEFVLAMEVFDRDASYDPRIDSIVRVEARRLRSKLRSYYEKEGVSDPILIAFRQGSYTPLFRSLEAPKAKVPAPAPAPAAERRPPTVAVLPFVNMSPEPDQDYFCDGITEEIINALASLEGLRVVARTSVFQFKGKAVDIREISRLLDATVVIEGSVRKAGENLRITAQLVEAASGFHLWSHVYDRKLGDVFAIQEEISRSIAAVLQVKLGEKDRKPAAAGEASLEAYHLYLKARYHWHKQTLEGFQQSLDIYNRLVQDHPDYALAYAGRAEAYAMLATFGGLPPAEACRLLVRDAEAALRLDPNRAEAYNALGGMYCFHQWDWEQGRRHFEQALRLQPGYALAHSWRALMLLATGDTQGAVAAHRKVLELDPLSLDAHCTMALIYHHARHYALAVKQSKAALELAPRHASALAQLGLALARQGHYAEALEHLKLARKQSHDALTSAHVAEVLAMSGQTTRARAVVRELKERAKREYLTPVAFVWACAGLGDWDAMFHWAERSVQEHAVMLSWAKTDPRFDPVRQDARFHNLLRKMNLDA